MAQRAIREYDGKTMMARLLEEYSDGKHRIENRFVQITPETDFKKLGKKYPWLLKQKLVVKPDQLIKRRGKNKLLLLNASFKDAESWITKRMNKNITVQNVTGKLTHFIVEPFIIHNEEDEYYVCIRSVRKGDEILFYHHGGINVGDVDTKSEKLLVPVSSKTDQKEIKKILRNVPEGRKKLIAGFIHALFSFYSDLNYAYLEINPFIVVKNRVVPLDMAAKIDDTGEFESGSKWGKIVFPAPFGRTLGREEAYIKNLDSKTGASLKLTILNPKGRVWTLVAGGGASVVYADTISDLGFGKELANYGEYSGNPSEEFTYQYAKTVLDLMTREKNPKGKTLIIGGGIANFTDVAKTFKGIIRALKDYQKKLMENRVKIYVRRGGPNYQQGLKMMKDLGSTLGVPVEVYGPETHMTRIVSMGLKGGRK